MLGTKRQDCPAGRVIRPAQDSTGADKLSDEIEDQAVAVRGAKTEEPSPKS